MLKVIGNRCWGIELKDCISELRLLMVRPNPPVKFDFTIQAWESRALEKSAYCLGHWGCESEGSGCMLRVQKSGLNLGRDLNRQPEPGMFDFSAAALCLSSFLPDL